MSKCHAFCEAQNARHFAMPLMRGVDMTFAVNGAGIFLITSWRFSEEDEDVRRRGQYVDGGSC
jgi:hypothetical protein